MNQSPKSILIVDDEPAVLNVLRNSLKKFGDAYKVSTALNGKEALDLGNSQDFDLVITDYRMPDMDGLELLESFQRLQPQARIILMTAYGSGGLEKEAKRLKAYQYVNKPLEINTFREMVQQALERGSSTRLGILMLSEECYLAINQMLQRLKGDVGARCIFFADADGHYIAGTGDTAMLPLEQIASLVGCGVASLLEVGRLMDGSTDSINLFYREGKRESIYVVNIGIQFLMIIVIDVGQFSTKLGLVWYHAQQYALQLQKQLSDSAEQNTAPSAVFDHNTADALDTQLDLLFDIEPEPADPKPLPLSSNTSTPQKSVSPSQCVTRPAPVSMGYPIQIAASKPASSVPQTTPRAGSPVVQPVPASAANNAPYPIPAIVTPPARPSPAANTQTAHSVEKLEPLDLTLFSNLLTYEQAVAAGLFKDNPLNDNPEPKDPS